VKINMEITELQMLQALPLDIKIAKSKLRIEEWFYHYGGKVYISFSGGKDSTVLLHLVRSLFPDVIGVYIDTGLEYPEIRSFVKTFDNIIWLKPKMNFKQVIEKYGYPIISKEQAQYIQQYRNAKSEKTKNTRMNGDAKGRFKISEKWKYLLTAPFKISEQCCNVMKKQPIKKHEKETGNQPIIGTMANESILRKSNYLKHGCNGFKMKRPTSTPLGFWTEQDILQYIKENNLEYASVYGDIIEEDNKLRTTKCDRTGCMFCGFGCHLDRQPNRFQRMKETHPKLYDYCMDKLGMREVLKYIGVKVE